MESGRQEHPQPAAGFLPMSVTAGGGVEAAIGGLGSDGPLGTWMRSNVPGFRNLERVSSASQGHSNITLFLEDDLGSGLVLRRPPLGLGLPSAHNVIREATVLKALHSSPIPVPRVIATCDDIQVIGAPFYIMERVRGSVINTIQDAASTPFSQRRAIGLHLPRVLAELHMVDATRGELSRLARVEGFVDRQLRRWHRQWQWPEDREETASFLECHVGLLERKPVDPSDPTVVHGDYRIGNTIVQDGSVRAVLDWELSTLGDPLADVAYLMNHWSDPGEEHTNPISSPIAAGGFGTRADVLYEYEATKGAAVDRNALRFFRAFSYWRLASIRSGVAIRLTQSYSLADRENAAIARRSIPVLLRATRELLTNPEAPVERAVLSDEGPPCKGTGKKYPSVIWP